MISRKRLLALGAMPLAACLFTACGGSGGGGGGGTNNTPTGDPPTFSGSISESGPGPTITLSPGASDPDGDTMTFTYRFQSGPLSLAAGTEWPEGVITTPNADGTVDVTFPVNGTYVIRVAADDGNGNITTTDITVDLTNSSPFSISGKVEDTVSSMTSGKSGLDCELIWTKPTKPDSIPILIDTTSGSGNFSFDGLLGPADDFEVLVPGS